MTIAKNPQGKLHLFQEIAEAVPAMVAVYNIHTGEYIYVNKAVKKLLGYTPEDFTKKGLQYIATLVHPDDIARIMEENAKVLKEANKKSNVSKNDSIVNFEYRMRHKNGSWRWLHTDGSVFSRDANGKVECVLNASLDITRRKEAEEKNKILNLELEKRVTERTKELKESEERYQAFLSQSSEGIWRFEVDKPISIKLSVTKQLEFCFKYAYLAECNDALAKMYGYTNAKDIIGARLDDFLPPTDERNKAYLTSFITSDYRMLNAESHEKDKYGNDRVFQNNLIGIVENGYLVRAWGTQRDITDIKKLEQRKDDFIALASHELKTPITSLKMFTQVLHHRLKKQADQQLIKNLGAMDNQITKLTELINSLLDLSLVQKGKLTYKKHAFAVEELITETVENIQRITKTHKITIKGQIQEHIKADRDRIGQVLTNLINNAIKYSPKAKKVIVSSTKKEGAIVISVQDFGIGISGSEQEKIFERFFQARNPTKQTFPGLGLGLYIAKEIIDRHKGKMWIDSQEGKGSVFYILLPIVLRKKR